MRRRQQALMWIAVAAILALGGMLSSSMEFVLVPPLMAQEGQEYPFYVKTSSDVIPGATECVFADAFLDLSTGNVLYCDPDEGRYKLAGVSTARNVIRIPGICEAAGPDSGKTCHNDDQCTDDAGCSGSVCNCLESDHLTGATYGPDGDPIGVKLTRFNAVTEEVEAYPGVADFALEGTFTESRFARMGWEPGCPAEGCYVFQLYGTDAVIFGDDNDPSGLTMNVKGKMALEGEGSGTSRTSGFAEGFWTLYSDSSGGDFLRAYSGFSDEAFTLIGKIANRSGKLSIDDGNLYAEEPYVLTNTRDVFWFGDDDITEVQIESSTAINPAGWSSGPNTDQGQPMPRDGHLTGLHIFCELNNTPVESGYLQVDVYLAGSSPTLLLSTQQHYVATGPFVWPPVTQARGVDPLAQGDLIRVVVGNMGVKTCEAGSPEGTDFICTNDTQCTGSGGACGISCDCLAFDSNGGADCSVGVEVTYDE